MVDEGGHQGAVLGQRGHGLTLLSIRAAAPDDEPFLWRMLTLAASMDGTDADVEAARLDPTLRCYLDAFGREGDLALVAWRGDERAGAAWIRLAPSSGETPAKVWTERVPELAIATLPEHRGGGIGNALLSAIIDAARGRYPAIALSVREGNPAVRLYERAGFVVERKTINRVGGTSLVMRRALS